MILVLLLLAIIPCLPALAILAYDESVKTQKPRRGNRERR